MGRKKSDFVDGKVLFHVRNFVEDNGVNLSEEVVLEHVLRNLIEYKRKPQNVLLKMVRKALQICSSEIGKGLSTPMKSSKMGKKRQRDGTEKSDSADSEDELQALKHEVSTPSHNLLNASLAGKYKAKLKEEKQKATGEKLKKKTNPKHWGNAVVEEVKNENLISDRPAVRYQDLGGIDDVLEEVRELIEYPLRHPEVYAHLGVAPPRGVLLHGPPGCGKTLLAYAVAGELGVTFIKVSAPEIVSGMSGESEQKLRDLFQQATANAPTIVFLDEIDAITPKRETSQRGMDKRIVAQLLTCMDDLGNSGVEAKPVIIIGVRPDALDMALRRAGRFDREITLGVPTQDARAKILAKLTAKMNLSGDFDYNLLARKTPGYVGADLASLASEAAAVAINRIFQKMTKQRNVDAEIIAPIENIDEADSAKYAQNGDAEQTCQNLNSAVATKDSVLGTDPLTEEQLKPLCITMEDFLAATKKVQPTSKREGFATVPDVTWDDIGALQAVRAELSLSVLEPIAYPERFEALGLSPAAGVLLYGPPGCGKTLLAKAVAHESGANFISVKGPELLDKYVGQSERAVRQVFERARASSPCVIFFDELDSLCPRRGAGGENGGVSERVVNQLLTEMDGLEARRSVWVIAATNRPELIDPAMLRPGRLDKLLYVPLPSIEDRASILTANTKAGTLSEDVDLEAVGRDSRAEGFSGADLAALVREAGLDVLRRLHNRLGTAGTTVDADMVPSAEGPTKKAYLKISMSNFDAAFEQVRPSVSKSSQKAYKMMKDSIHRSRAASIHESSPDAKTPQELHT
eukprot:CAMPEP_0117874916 /NCGR_PEP_ID=MMETSP0950-20121206/12631_1 /TAXON_ID=44440 /ORGANISM="Chattonella subsalsa, Strain CCMP2191" /LENGTH=804 /DNA_ID=CAMNT_0005728307 /DNA_START=294 /DNA_END=2708 /DNA_ORIENTATION=-